MLRQKSKENQDDDLLNEENDNHKYIEIFSPQYVKFYDAVSIYYATKLVFFNLNLKYKI